MDAAEIDRELEELEGKIEQLRAVYEQYFMGLERLEPLVLRRDVERRIRLLRREQLRNTAQRFKFNTVLQRFNTMQQHWARVVREIENGTYRRDVMRAAARFGEGALSVLGKRTAKHLAAAVARAQEKRPVEATLELGPDDLVAEEDEAPTPPRLERPAPPAPQVPRGNPLGLGQGDLPVIGTFNDEAASRAKPRAPMVPLALGPAQPVTMGETPKPAAGSLPWSRVAVPPSNPSSVIRPVSGEAKRRTATPDGEPAMTAAGKPALGFGELDLDFDDSLQVAHFTASPQMPPPPRAAKPPATAAPSPAHAPSPRAGASTPKPVVPVAGSSGRALVPPAQGSIMPTFSGALGALDVPFDGDALAPPAGRPAPPRETYPSSPASGIRPGVNRAGVPGGPNPAPPLAGAANSELPDQRIRQIYTKYLEAKRSTQESTAGVTFEKLAASLRDQANKLRSTHPNRSIDYEVVVKDGKAHLKPILR